MILIMFLHEIKTNQDFLIKRIPGDIKAELMRLGVCEGDKLKTLIKIPQGPIVLMKDLQEIAVGENLSKKIEVQSLEQTK